VIDFAGEPGMAVAWAQLIFNIVMVLLVLVLLRLFDRSLARFDSSDEVVQYREGGRGTIAA
jgi:Na+/phosphate symporter